MPTDPPVRPLSAEARAQAIAMLEWAIPRFALGPVAKFEQDAEEFYRETGHMAPGKSLPLEMCPSDDDARQAAWKTWTDARQARWIAVLQTAIAALRAPAPGPDATAARHEGTNGHREGPTEAEADRALVCTPSRGDLGSAPANPPSVVSSCSHAAHVDSLAGICSGCGGPHRLDTSVPSHQWNRVIRAAGLPDYLCTTCIIEAFARAGQGFTAELYGDSVGGVGPAIEVRVGGEELDTVRELRDENNRLRSELRRVDGGNALLTELCRPPQPSLRRVVGPDARTPYLADARLIEALADYAHDAWSRWMRHMFKLSAANPDGTVLIPAAFVDRWQRQVATPYAELSAPEQDSDRKEADRMIAIAALRHSPADPERVLCSRCGEPADAHGEFGFRDHAPKDADGNEIETPPAGPEGRAREAFEAGGDSARSWSHDKPSKESIDRQFAAHRAARAQEKT